MSTREMVFERIVVENMYVLESAALPLDDAQRCAALTASIIRSHRAGMEETYYLYRCFRTNNCTSSPFHEIDRIAHYNFLQRLGSHLYRLPLNPRLYLRLRGLDADPSVRKLVRAEFQAYISDPETVRRKRAYVRVRIQRFAPCETSGVRNWLASPWPLIRPSGTFSPTGRRKLKILLCLLSTEKTQLKIFLLPSGEVPAGRMRGAAKRMRGDCTRYGLQNGQAGFGLRRPRAGSRRRARSR